MRPVTEQVPKFLLPIAGVPFGVRQIEALRDQGVCKLVLSIGYKGEMIRELLGDGAQHGVRITYCDEGRNLKGTGGALRFAADQGLLEDRFFVLYGDSFLPIDFKPVWEAFVASAQPALMTVLLNEGRWDASNVIWESGKIELYQKKGATPEQVRRMTAIDYGLLVATRDWVMSTVPKGAVQDLAGPLTALSQQGRLAGFEVHERFFEAGSPKGLADLEAYFAKR